MNQMMSPADEGGTGGGAVAEAPAPAAASPAAASPAAPSPAANAPAAAPVAAPVAAAPAAAEKAEGYWPTDWREKASKGDAKVQAKLTRYGSPEAVAEALIAAQTRISSGELKPVLGKNATAEEVTAWRKEHGIPETADKYDLTGVALVDNDKPFIKEVLEVAHANNVSPEAAKAIVGVWPKIKEQADNKRAEDDAIRQTTAVDALRDEWGPEFRRHMNVISGLLDSTMPEAVKGQFLTMRLPDGTRVGDSPSMLRSLLSLALIKNPTGVVVPGSGADPVQGVNDEIAKIEKTMREDRKGYFKDEKLQARYRDLLAARETMK